MRHSTLRTLKALVAVAVLGLVTQVAWATAPSGRYTRGSCSGVSVYDTKTKLMWQQKPANNPTKTWSGAADYCRTVHTDGYVWRTPTVKELSTVVDYTEFPQGIGTTVDGSQFRLTTQVIWSATPDASGTLSSPPAGGPPVISGYAVDFSSGEVLLQTVGESLGVWCVSDASPILNC